MTDSTKAFLLLANGQVFEGESFGSTGCVVGETVFTTGMNGYLETLTDPSYYGQIVTQTFPLIGNYGVISKDFESADVHVKGYIVRSVCEIPSNFRCEYDLDTFLAARKIIGLCGIDTRTLTKILRETGVMNGMIVSGDGEEAQSIRKALKSEVEKAKLLKKIKSYKIKSAVESVTCNASKIEEPADVVFKESAEYRFVPVRSDGTKENDPVIAMKDGKGKKVVLWDFGAKANIRRELLKRGFEVVTVAGSSTAKEILALNPDGIMLSNGPGDPKENVKIIDEIKKIAKSGVPIFGICLGYQLLALANGSRTYKLKYGHRGANHPVINLENNKVMMTSQNHSYAVDIKSMSKAMHATYKNLTDDTLEGFEINSLGIYAVQFHPEAHPGPNDASIIFDDWVNIIKRNAEKLNEIKGGRNEK